MSTIVIMAKRSYMPQTRYVKEAEIGDQHMYLSGFVRMLRCSYSCLCAGVAFVNSCPSITSNFAKRLRCASVFSEWIGHIIMIQNDHRYKLSTISMGAEVEMSMNDSFKSFESLRKYLSHTLDFEYIFYN